MMGEIYQEASKVHVWLGDGQEWKQAIRSEEDSEHVDILEVSNILAYFSVLFRTSNLRVSREIVEANIANFFNQTPALFELVQKFLHAPWFRRRWAIQQVALKAHVVVRHGHQTAWEEYGGQPTDNQV